MNGNLYVEQVQPRRVVLDNIGALNRGGAETLATRMDTASETGITYVGKAQPGTNTSSASWQIQKLDETGTPETLVITYADGNAEFDNVWNDRLSLSYS